MKIKFGSVYFFVALAVSSFCMQHLTTMAESKREAHVTVAKKEVILGHRIGPNGQEMLVVR